MKTELLLYLIRRRGSLKNKKILIFMRTRLRAERLAERLVQAGFKAAAIHKVVWLFGSFFVIEGGGGGGLNNFFFYNLKFCNTVTQLVYPKLL